MTSSRPPLASRRCQALPSGTKPLAVTAVARLLPEVPGWKHSGGRLQRTFQFGGFHQTMAFVNAVAWIAHSEDHHPDLAVSFGGCSIAYSTHSVRGISMNDFICAAKINALFDSDPAPRR